MLTIFSVPKAFTGEMRIIQDNAIGSWKRLKPPCEIILVGDDPGVAEAAARHGVKHQPLIACNEFGTPILANVFVDMNTLARFEILALVNADILLLEDFFPAIDAVTRLRTRFMMVASRFNLRIDQPLTFERDWSAELRQRARAEDCMYPAAGSDIFVYPRGLLDAVPPFAIGRGYWDNWLMYETRRVGTDLIDVTAVVTTVHQMHAYDSMAGAGVAPGISIDRHVYETEEGQRNLKMAGGRGCLFTVYDATQILGADRRLHSTLSPSLIRRRMKAVLRRRIQSLSP